MTGDHPGLLLRRPLKVGAKVRVNRGFHKGQLGIVVECLTPDGAGNLYLLDPPNDAMDSEVRLGHAFRPLVHEPDGDDTDDESDGDSAQPDRPIDPGNIWLSGHSNYGVRFDLDDQVHDYRRFELVERTQRRLADEARARSKS